MRGQPNHHQRVNIFEPTVVTYCVNHKYKQLARIFRHLRDELHHCNPRLAKPTTTMIEHLVFNCPLPLLNGDDWQEIIQNVLQYMIDHLTPTHFDEELFLRSDGNLPLFPNEELFDQHDAYLFAKAILTHQQQNFM